MRYRPPFGMAAHRTPLRGLRATVLALVLAVLPAAASAGIVVLDDSPVELVAPRPSRGPMTLISAAVLRRK